MSSTLSERTLLPSALQKAFLTTPSVARPCASRRDLSLPSHTITLSTPPSIHTLPPIHPSARTSSLSSPSTSPSSPTSTTKHGQPLPPPPHHHRVRPLTDYASPCTNPSTHRSPVLLHQSRCSSLLFRHFSSHACHFVQQTILQPGPLLQHSKRPRLRRRHNVCACSCSCSIVPPRSASTQVRRTL